MTDQNKKRQWEQRLSIQQIKKKILGFETNTQYVQ